MKPTFYEFFAGGGMARAGLGDDWQCLFANDIDRKKGDTYVANYGHAEFCLRDIHDLKADDLPGQADLAWASFPCQDLSLAGNGDGLAGVHSGAFWGLFDLIHALKFRSRAPKLLVLENVGGALTSKDGRDFEELCRALKMLNYVFGAIMLDAVHFVPQSRPRIFFIATTRALADANRHLFSATAEKWMTPRALLDAHAALRPEIKRSWRWWHLRPPQARQQTLLDVLLEQPSDVAWHSSAETQRLLRMMSPVNLAKVRAARALKAKTAGTIYKRTRLDETGKKVQRAEVRFDGISGCLRTPRGGSSRQTLIVVEGRAVRTRLLSGREAARLMGLSDDYVLPNNYNEAYHVSGDGLAVPVVSFLTKHLLLPLANQHSSKILVAAE